MAVRLSPLTPRLPIFLQRRCTDEYTPVPYSSFQRHAIPRLRAAGPANAKRLNMSLADYWSGRQGIAAALLAIDEAAGGGFYNVPKEAALDRAAADEALGGSQFVMDLQTHYVADRTDYTKWARLMVGTADTVKADRFKGLEKLVYDQNKIGYTLAEYLRCVYLDSETSVAVLTSGPGALNSGFGAGEQDNMRMVSNPEMFGTRELVDRLAGTGRLINHCVVHPNVDGELENMDLWKEWCKPAGWKVYTVYGASGDGPMKWGDKSWMLDAEDSGIPFLERVRASEAPVVAAHKGISVGADTGWNGPSSPKDVGPVAKAFPDITFIIYHSGYDVREGDQEEGPFSPDDPAPTGVNRLIKSLRDHKIEPGSNVHAELGTTWYQIMAHPVEAAHVMGKLLAALGEDNICWGTDCIFYGPSQPMIDVFRAFQIPEEFRERYGYPQLTPRAKEKILGLNAARIYGVDVEKTLDSIRNDDLAWVKAAMQEYSITGTPSAI